MDARRKKTRDSISRYYLQLLAEKPARQITVSELCRLAQINRATFYKHFLDIPDLQEQLEEELLSDFRNLLQGISFSTKQQYRDCLIELVAFTKQTASRLYPLFSANADSQMLEKLFQTLYELSYPRLREKLPQLSDGKAKMLYRYVTAGNGSMLAMWLSGESDVSLEETVDMIMCINNAAIQEVLKESGESI